MHRVGPSRFGLPFRRRAPTFVVGLGLVLFLAAEPAPARHLWPARCGLLPVASVCTGLDDPVEDEPDDRLSRTDRRLVHELTERGMPELVAELLSDHSRMHRVYVARAYARAGVDTTDAALRKRFFKAARKEYRKVIALEDDADWLRGLRRRLEIAQWRVELADLILRHWLAPDLDRYEITSGLDFDHRRLEKMLREAHGLYSDAAHSLETFLVGLRIEEERFLLLGLGGRITMLYEHRQLNGAWAAVYLAMVGDGESIDRKHLLEIALGGFDAVYRTAEEPARKYNALLGAGISLRERARYAEANAAFDLVRNSTAPLSLTARAGHEKARSLMLAGQFDAARRELDGLAAISTDRLTGEDAGAAFYVRLAPLIHAYTYMLEAEQGRGRPSLKERLREMAFSALAAISQRGGVWPEITRVYVSAITGPARGLEELGPTELRIAAMGSMADEKYAEAIKAFQALLDRSDAAAMHAEARFNLGVCYFQTRALRAAAEAFMHVARDEAAADLAESAAEYAHRCWRQVARASKEARDYLALAEASELLAAKFPDHALAAEAGRVAALARQEGGDYRGALAAYLGVPPDAPHYWDARRNVARCKQRIFEQLPADASPGRRTRAARDAAATWIKLAEDISAMDEAASSGGGDGAENVGIGSESERRAWIAETRLAAAALLTGGDVRAFDEGLAALADMASTARVLSLRIRCHRGLGDLETARRTLDEYLGQAGGNEIGAVLLELAAEMETEIARLRGAGRYRDAIWMAKESIPTIRQLLGWIEAQPDHRKYVPVVRLSLAKALSGAKRYDEAMSLLERLMADDPGNGSYVQAAAGLQEDFALIAGSADREAALDGAESLWARLLKDPTLRDRVPDVYWEARYHWLKHQLRHGRAGDVIKGIETQRVWDPDLGGPKWRGRLLQLAAEARMAGGGG